MNKLLVTIGILLMSMQDAGASFWSDDPIEKDSIEISTYQKTKFVPRDLLSVVWKEARSNDKLIEFRLTVTITDIRDQYGNRSKKSAGTIYFNKRDIERIRKYKKSWYFDDPKNQLHKETLKKYLDLVYGSID